MCRVVRGLASTKLVELGNSGGTDDNRNGTMEEGTMWIALFSIASAAAVCLTVAAVVLQATQGDALRG